MNTLSIRDCISFGWNTFKIRPWFFVSAALMVLAVSLVSGFLQGAITNLAGKEIGSIISLAIALGVNIVVSLGVIALYLKAHDNANGATLMDLWHPTPFWRYLGTILLIAAGTVVGLVLLIIPGIIFAVACGLARFIVVERRISPLAALKESARITRGNRAALCGLLLAIVGINILGAFALVVGLFVSIPVSMLATVHAYRTLAGASPALTS
jgi:uncharacterized membrane protein